MAERPPDAPEEQDPRKGYHGLVALHALAGDIDLAAIPGFDPPPAEQALRDVAAASKEEVPDSARIGVLTSLARAGLLEPDQPHAAAVRELSESIAGDRDGLVGGDLLEDVKRSVAPDVLLRDTRQGQLLDHHETAFVDEDVCTAKRVKVGSLDAVWVFSEFETDAPFASVVEWLKPENWPRWGPLFFLGMDLVGSPNTVSLGPPGDPHWHGIFHEEVQLPLRTLNTLLHCDFWQDGQRAAGMTYDLALSLDGELDVDRGFLLVNDTGSVNAAGQRLSRVKALKIVGFTDKTYNDWALQVCPFWTDWMRWAVREASTTLPGQPGQTPGGSSQTGTGGEGGRLGENFEAWTRYFGTSARKYVEIFEDVTTRVSLSGVSAAECLKDEKRLWDQMAKDWSKAWSYGMETLDEMAEHGLDAGLAPPDTPRESARGLATAVTSGAASDVGGGLEATVIPVPRLAASDQPVVSDLVAIEAGGAKIPASVIQVSVAALGDGERGVRLRVTDRSFAAGLYVGDLRNAQGQVLAPAQIYISQALEGNG